MTTEKRNRVNPVDAILMLIVAAGFDFLQGWLEVIPYIGWILSATLSFVAWISFYLWTSIKGWGLSDTVKKIIVMWAIPVLEFVPLLHLLPGWTLNVLLNISFLKAEDVLYNTTHGKVDVEKMLGNKRVRRLVE